MASPVGYGSCNLPGFFFVQIRQIPLVETWRTGRKNAGKAGKKRAGLTGRTGCVWVGPMNNEIAASAAKAFLSAIKNETVPFNRNKVQPKIEQALRKQGLTFTESMPVAAKIFEILSGWFSSLILAKKDLPTKKDIVAVLTNNYMKSNPNNQKSYTAGGQLTPKGVKLGRQGFDVNGNWSLWVGIPGKARLTKIQTNGVLKHFRSKESYQLPIALREIDEYVTRFVMPKRNPAKSVGDNVAATELVLYSDNDSDIYNFVVRNILPNQFRKLRSGKYDSNKAVRIWEIVAERAAHKYVKEFGGDYATTFNKATRLIAAKVLHAAFERNLLAGEYSDEPLLKGVRFTKVN